MKFWMLTTLLLSLAAHAAEDTVHTRSVSKFVTDTEYSSEQLLQQQGREVMDSRSVLSKPRGMESVDLAEAQLAQRSVAGVTTSANFELFDAWVELSGDADYDGYFYRINVAFDADVDTSLETVYAKLYLSRNGGDWVQYSSSDLFEIRYDDSADTFEVVSELIDGYRPDYYDVLIELYAMNHSGVVASRVIQQDQTGYLITLEDSGYDDPYASASGTTTVETTTVYGAGSLSLAGMLMYALLLSIKLRYFRRSSTLQQA